jgi:hypothetical protein
LRSTTRLDLPFRALSAVSMYWSFLVNKAMPHNLRFDLGGTCTAKLQVAAAGRQPARRAPVKRMQRARRAPGLIGAGESERQQPPSGGSQRKEITTWHF